MANRKKTTPGYDFSSFGRGALSGIIGTSPLDAPLPIHLPDAPRRRDTIKAAPKPKGVLTRMASDAVEGVSKFLGSSESEAAQRAARFEQANLDYNPLSAPDQLGTQAGYGLRGDPVDRSALTSGAIGTGLGVAGEFAKPALGVLSKTQLGKAVTEFMGKTVGGAMPVESGILQGSVLTKRSVQAARRHTADVRTKTGAIVTPRAAQPGELTSPGKIAPLPGDEGDVPLTHFSYKPALTETDPAKLGSNPRRLTSREELYAAQPNPRSYFGVNLGDEGDYIGKRAPDQFEYSGSIPKHRLLHTGSTGQTAIRDAAREIIKKQDRRFGSYGVNGTALMDRLTRNSGYAGVLYHPEASSIGRIAQIFEKQPVKRVTPTIPADFLPNNLDNAMTRGDWSIATGANPMGRQLPDAENASRNAAFQADAAGLGADTHPVAGKYGNEEDSFLVSPVNQEQAVGLGQRFDQDSVLTNRGLLMHDGTRVPAAGATSFATPPADFYSSMAVGGTNAQKRQTANFALNLPDDMGAIPDPTRMGVLAQAQPRVRP